MMRFMPSLQIRDLPDDVYEALAYRAQRAGRSLAQQALAALRQMTHLGRRDRRLATLERIAQEPRPAGAGDWPSPEELIRRDRDR